MDTRQDLEKLAQEIETSLGTHFSEPTDQQILVLAQKLRRARYIQWKTLMNEMTRPTMKPGEYEVSSGELSLTPKLTTDFHKELVTEVWRKKLEHFISQHPAISGFGGSGHLLPSFNEQRFMGPQSVVKYRFQVAVILRRPRSPLKWQASFFIEYRPKLENFKMFWFRLNFDWRVDILQQALVRGQLVTVQDFEKALEASRKASRVRSLLGLASPVRALLQGGVLHDHQLKVLLTEDCGVVKFSESELANSKLLPHRGHSHLYQAVSLESQGKMYIVMANGSTVEEFQYAQFGTKGALPAFADEGAVERSILKAKVQL